MAEFRFQSSWSQLNLTPEKLANRIDFSNESKGEQPDDELDSYHLPPLSFDETTMEMLWDLPPSPANPLITQIQQTLKKKSSSKQSLRHLSWRVKEIVATMGKATYKEVANQLVAEMCDESTSHRAKAERNLRRRVYDALNVLIASEVLTKQGKTVATQSQVSHHVSTNPDLFKKKKKRLRNLVDAYVATRHLLERNHFQAQPGLAVQYPLSVVTLGNGVQYDLDVSTKKDSSSAVVKFHGSYELLSNISVLKKLGLHRKAVNLPPELNALRR